MARGTRNSNGNSGDGDRGVESSEYVDPRDVDASNASEEVTIDGDSASIGSEPRRQRRGRKPGSQKKASLDLKGIEGILLSAHWMIAAAVKVPELRLTQPEAAGLALAMQNVARHYPTVHATQQTLDWVALIVCCATVYGTKMSAYSVRVKREKAGVRGNSPVVQFPTPPQGA